MHMWYTYFSHCCAYLAPHHHMHSYQRLGGPHLAGFQPPITNCLTFSRVWFLEQGATISQVERIVALLVLECLQSCGLFFTRELGSHESHFQTLQSMVPNSHVCPTQWVRWKALLPNRYMASPRVSPSSTLGRLFLGNMQRRVVSLVAIGDPCDNNNVMEACITYISSPLPPFQSLFAQV